MDYLIADWSLTQKLNRRRKKSTDDGKNSVGDSKPDWDSKPTKDSKK